MKTDNEHPEIDALQQSVRAQEVQIQGVTEQVTAVDRKVDKLADAMRDGFLDLTERISDLANKLWQTNEKASAATLSLAKKGGAGVAGGTIAVTVWELVQRVFMR